MIERLSLGEQPRDVATAMGVGFFRIVPIAIDQANLIKRLQSLK